MSMDYWPTIDPVVRARDTISDEVILIGSGFLMWYACKSDKGKSTKFMGFHMLARKLFRFIWCHLFSVLRLRVIIVTSLSSADLGERVPLNHEINRAVKALDYSKGRAKDSPDTLNILYNLWR